MLAQYGDNAVVTKCHPWAFSIALLSWFDAQSLKQILQRNWKLIKTFLFWPASQHYKQVWLDLVAAEDIWTEIPSNVKLLIVWMPCRWKQFCSCQKACTKLAISLNTNPSCNISDWGKAIVQHERQSFLLFSYQQCRPNTLLYSNIGGYIATKHKPLLFILSCHEGDHRLRVHCYNESKPILWESEMCLTTISQTMPRQTASNPTGPARNNPRSVRSL